MRWRKSLNVSESEAGGGRKRPVDALRRDQSVVLTEATDAFGHIQAAKAIAGIVRTADAPFTLGVFAPWGAGKTSVLKTLAEFMSGDDDTALVIFNVWRYEADGLRRQFLLDLVQQLDDSSKFKSELASSTWRNR